MNREALSVKRMDRRKREYPGARAPRALRVLRVVPHPSR